MTPFLASPLGDALIFEILGVVFSFIPTDDLIERVTQAAFARQGLSVFIPNAHTLNLACDHPEFRAVLGRGDVVINDGTGVRIAARRAGIAHLENQNGTDLVPAICRAGAAKGMRIYWLGGADGRAEAAAEHLMATYPGLEVVGVHNGYFTRGDEAGICAEIRTLQPHLVLVSLGNPAQEEWIDRNLADLGGAVAIGVGALVDRLSGHVVRAPLIVRRLGFEWLHRLMRTPSLWRRYVLGNPRFLWRIARDRPQVLAWPDHHRAEPVDLS